MFYGFLDISEKTHDDGDFIEIQEEAEAKKIVNSLMETL